MMRNGPSFQTYYREITRLTHGRLDKEDSDCLLQVNFEEYLDFLVNEAKWEPLIWDESQKTVEPYAIKRQRSDEFFERTYQVEEQHFRIRIPISPHPQRAEYFKFQPSKFWGLEPEWKFEDNVLILEVLATEQAVNKGLEQIRFWLGNRNSEIEEGNKHLRDHIRPAWEAKRKQIEDRLGTTNTLLQKLNIPLHQDPFAKTKPIEIKPHQMRTVIEKPKSTSKSEPNLNKDDVVLTCPQ